MKDLKVVVEQQNNAIDIISSQGYSLRPGAFYAWLKDNDYTTKTMARRMSMSEQDLITKLENNLLFDRQQITSLVNFMGAEDAFFVIHFPTFEFRQNVYAAVFLREMPVGKRRKGGVRYG